MGFICAMYPFIHFLFIIFFTECLCYVPGSEIELVPALNELKVLVWGAVGRGREPWARKTDKQISYSDSVMITKTVVGTTTKIPMGKNLLAMVPEKLGKEKKILQRIGRLS